MCGILGFNWDNKALATRLAKHLSHRGPDASDSYSDENVSFGHTRLSIIDLSKEGKQPMTYEYDDQEVMIVYNGEVYNYKELRQELEKWGHEFETETDTEVILASYIEWGTDCVEKFNGMWAFCIYDPDEKTLFLSRDRMGQKPLYYYEKDGRFMFSSELKALMNYKKLGLTQKDSIDLDAVRLYFSLGFIPSPYSIFRDVKKLGPRQSMIFDLAEDEIRDKWQYYEIPDFDPEDDKEELIREGRKLLRDSMRLRMRSDVPVGAFLSGGLDSSTTVGLMRAFTDLSKLHTFSIGFEGHYDETMFMELVRDYYGTNHHHDYFREEDFEDLIDVFPEVYDEPFGDFSGFPTYALSELATQHVTVSLSGDGGDEIFGGYEVHRTGARMDSLRKWPRFLRRLGSKLPAEENLDSFYNLYTLKKGMELSLEEPEDFYAEQLGDDTYKPEIYKEWTREKLKYSLEKGGGSLAEGLRIFDLLFRTMGDHFLVKVDRASMANSLEVRSPFLDHRFMEYSQRIPTKEKVDSFNTKKIMRDLISDIVPEEIFERGKHTFTPPVEEWILQEEYEDDLDEALEIIEGLDKDLHSFYERTVFSSKDRMYSRYKVWLFIFGKWWERWME